MTEDVGDYDLKAKDLRQRFAIWSRKTLNDDHQSVLHLATKSAKRKMVTASLATRHGCASYRVLTAMTKSSVTGQPNWLTRLAICTASRVGGG